MSKRTEHMILQVSGVCVSFDGKDILKDCSFHIEEGEKCAIVGINGAGKSTLLKVITGNLSQDSGTVTMKSDMSWGYLAQQDAVDSDNTIWEEVLSVKQDLIDEENKIRELENRMHSSPSHELDAIMERYAALTHDFELRNGFAVRSEVTGVLRGLGFSDDEFDKVVGTLSGGQKTRLALAKLLLSKPSLLILDEPTNHLDLSSIEFLENYLKNTKSAVIVVAHDRYFLDRIVTKVIEIENTKATSYEGNYTLFSKKKQQLADAMLKAYLNQQEKIQHEEKVIEKLKSFNREKSIKRAESREKLLDKMERIEKPVSENAAMRFSITPSIISGRDVLQVMSLSKAFGDNVLFSDISFGITRGEKVAIIGDNGTGKTTLLKILTGLCDPDSGSFTLGVNVKIGYYDQEHQVLSPEKTLFDELSDSYPDMDNTRIRNTLAAFLFYKDDVYKKVADLSGGERGRLSLARLMLSNANLLILDEPTNHLDMISRQILESAINEYEGTVLYVSHDRYFINSTATRILDLKDGTFTGYPGNYDYYIEKRDEFRELSVPEGSDKSSPATGPTFTGTLSKSDAASVSSVGSKSDWEEQKAQQARLRKAQNDIKKCEDEIASLEAELEEINKTMSDPSIATDAQKLTDLTTKAGEISDKLGSLYERWESLNT